MYESKFYFIIEGIIVIATVIFMFMLRNFNQELAFIQGMYNNKIESAFAIASTPGYFGYLAMGFFFVFVLVAYSIKCFKLVITLDFRIIINCIINVILLIRLLVIFSNPVLTTFATLLLVAGLFIIANSS
ncbi:hypothetical protein [Oceanobacillus oncorhynchi]|uniref:hypothetical protein n=1 Tax=Oceanobacillus oncorhynchi TaxID=545501 RepID=UPI0034D6A31F